MMRLFWCSKIVFQPFHPHLRPWLWELNTKYGTRLAASGAVQGSAGPNENNISDSKVDDLWIISIDKRVREGGCLERGGKAERWG